MSQSAAQKKTTIKMPNDSFSSFSKLNNRDKQIDRFQNLFMYVDIDVNISVYLSCENYSTLLICDVVIIVRPLFIFKY